MNGIIAEGGSVTPCACIKVGIVDQLGEACIVVGPRQN